MIYTPCFECGGTFTKRLRTKVVGDKIYKSRSSRCIYCERSMQLDYYYSLKGDPEKHKRFIENRKKYNKKIKQKRLEYYKDYRKKYPERISSYSLKYYYKNRDKCLKDNKEWRNKNIIPKWKEEFININKFKRINKESLKTRQVKTKYDKPFCIRRTPKDLVSII